jgi:hypothetical protein
MLTDGGGWTLIISQRAGLFVNDMETYTNDVPGLDNSAALKWYINSDLSCVANQANVQNVAGETHTFNFVDFVKLGAINVNNDNYVAMEADGTGIIAGDNYPVIYHYDPSCSSARIGSYTPNDPVVGPPTAPGYKVSGCSTGYSYGTMILFQWHPSLCVNSPPGCAHFGGNAHIETSWCRRGSYLWVR